MLSPQQVERLFQFCRQHYVAMYDVQVELVDHLANAIEEKMKADSSLGFETALAKVYAGFGITGFSKIVAARTNAVLRSGRKHRWKLFRAYFTIPKLAMTACIFLMFAILPKLLSGDALSVTVLVLLAALVCLELSVTKKIGRMMKQQTLPLLITQPGYETSWFSSVLGAQFIICFADYEKFSRLTASGSWTGYLFLTAMMTISFVSLLAYKEHASKLVVYARTQFPEAFTIAQ